MVELPGRVEEALMDNDNDFSSYVTATRFQTAMGIIIAIQLLRSAAADAEGRVRSTLQRMREAAIAAQAVMVERLRTAPATLKPIDLRLDGGFVGLREVLEGKARLVGTEIAERAARLLRLVFPQGTAFVQLALAEEWVVAKAHLERIEKDLLAAEIAAVAGPEFLPFIIEAHTALGAGLGLGETALTAADTDALRRANQALSKAIAAYGRAMVGQVDEDDPESVAAFKRAMYPLDAYRRTAFARGATAETETELVDPALDVSPTDPIPPLPADPTA